MVVRLRRARVGRCQDEVLIQSYNGLCPFMNSPYWEFLQTGGVLFVMLFTAVQSGERPLFYGQ